MMDIDLRLASPIVDRHREDLELPSESAKSEYATKFRERMEAFCNRSNDDFRHSVTIAVDAAKSFVQIAIAVIVAIGGFVQFGIKSGLEVLSAPVLILALAAILVFLSMCFGMTAIGKAFQRGEGRIDPEKPPWSTEALKFQLNWQAVLGVLGLVAFASAIILWNLPDQNQSNLVVAVPEVTLTTGKSVLVEGQWSTLVVKQPDGFIMDLGTVPPGERKSFQVMMK